VLRFDVFGRGFSDRPNVNYNINLSYRQLSGLIDSLQLSTPVNLVGLSWGGRVVSYYAALHPNKVDKLVLVDPSGFEPVIRKDSTSVDVSPEKVTKALEENAPSMAESQLEDFYHPEKFKYWPALYKPQMEYKGFVHALLSTQANKRDLNIYMSKLVENRTHVKLIMGKEDQVVIPKETIPLAKKQIPGIDITLIENAGHLPHIEESEEFNKAFFEFLELD
jgi:pimeloyl-ACP methyl ester carboxylesterase